MGNVVFLSIEPLHMVQKFELLGWDAIPFRNLIEQVRSDNINIMVVDHVNGTLVKTIPPQLLHLHLIVKGVAHAPCLLMMVPSHPRILLSRLSIFNIIFNLVFFHLTFIYMMLH
jgi:hypothetical protein